MSSIYRKLKDYVQETSYGYTSIFGTIMDRSCIYSFEDENGECREFNCKGVYGHEYDFLYEYYVRGIVPIYKIEDDKIVPYLRITLGKDDE